MAVYVVEGGSRLSGEIDIQGSKNAVLPLMAAAILNKGVTILDNCPLINDVYVMADIIRYAGCSVTVSGHRMVIDAECISNTCLELEKVADVRASVLLLGALTARCGHAGMRYPGGCNIGERPVNYHLDSFIRMGIQVVHGDTMIECLGCSIDGGVVRLPFPSVGATENIMLAACGAENDTVIDNAAREPEIVELSRLLTKYGYIIKGAGTSVICVSGRNGRTETCVEHTVVSDRIVAGTYAYAAAITYGEVTCMVNDMTIVDSAIEVLMKTGCTITSGNDYFRVKAGSCIKPLPYIETEPYPGFPTDMQSQLMAVLSAAGGTSVVREKIFENRFHVASELIKMGADVSILGDEAVIHGKKQLKGADVSARDLRGGAALITAGLGAEGTTYIHDPGYIIRGYENITGDIIRLGGNIRYE